MKLCALTLPSHFQQQGLFCNAGVVLPCAMETVSAAPVNGLSGGLPPPPTPPSQPPSPFGSSKQQMTTAGNQGALTKGGDGSLQEEDRGVDLSYDVNVKKENLDNVDGMVVKPLHAGFKVKNECGLKVKNEFKSDNSHQSTTSVKSTGSLGGGRLQIFKEGRMLLELCHKEGDKVSWVATTKKVYWPPTGPATHTARLDSSASNTTAVSGSDGSLETGSVHSPHPSLSPWGQGQTHSPRPSPSYPPLASPCALPSPRTQGHSRRVKAVPRKLTSPLPEKVFAMKPPQGIRNYRKKIRPYKRKCRNGTEIKIGLFILKLECNAATGWVKKARRHIPQERRIARLNNQINKITNFKSKLHVPIQAWKTGRTDLDSLIKGGSSPAPSSHSGGLRIKSELKMVTETCTASVTSVTATPRFTAKVKAETRTVTAETRTVPVRTMPITPTVARVKQDHPQDRLKSATVTGLMSPEMQRVRMEIGPQNPLMGGVLREDRDGNFASPRKRYRDFDNGSPSAKNRRLSSEHRLSTDSLGSTSDRSSPYRAPHSPHRVPPLSPSHGGASPRPIPKVSNFSIDSIMGGGGGGGTPKPLTPVKNPASVKSPSQAPLIPTPNRPSPAPVKTPPPPSPFSSPFPGYHGVHPLLQSDPRFQSLLDPRVAQLAQLSQQIQLSQLQQLSDPRLAHLASLSDPRLSHMSDPRLNPMVDPRLTPGSAYPFSPFSPYTAFSAASASPSSSQSNQPPTSVWTPPVASQSVTSPLETPSPSAIAPPRAFANSPASPVLRMEPRQHSIPFSAHRTPETPSRPPEMAFRGLPKTPMVPPTHASEDAPLNLSMKPTSL